MTMSKQRTFRKPRPAKLGKRAETVVATLSTGAHLCSGVTPQGGEGGKVFWLEPSGKAVGPITARKLIGLGLVVPQNDDLFIDAPQSWRLA